MPRKSTNIVAIMTATALFVATLIIPITSAQSEETDAESVSLVFEIWLFTNDQIEAPDQIFKNRNLSGCVPPNPADTVTVYRPESDPSRWQPIPLSMTIGSRGHRDPKCDTPRNAAALAEHGQMVVEPAEEFLSRATMHTIELDEVSLGVLEPMKINASDHETWWLHLEIVEIDNDGVSMRMDLEQIVKIRGVTRREVWAENSRLQADRSGIRGQGRSYPVSVEKWRGSYLRVPEYHSMPTAENAWFVRTYMPESGEVTNLEINSIVVGLLMPWSSRID